MFEVNSSILTPLTRTSIFLILAGTTRVDRYIYASQPKYEFEWFCILMTCKQQWPRSSKLSTLHISTIFTHEEDLSAFKTLSLCIYMYMYVCMHATLRLQGAVKRSQKLE